MRPAFALFFITVALLVGCKNNKVQLAQLNAQYKIVNQQYFNDCIAPAQGGTDVYFKGEKPKVATPQEEATHNKKCALELQNVKALEQQIATLSK